MSRPQWTLSLLLGLVAWALMAMPAPRALAGADANDVVAARMCGWLDIDAGSVDGAYPTGERAEMSASPRVNTLKFRVAPEAPAPATRVESAEQAAVEAPVACQTVEALVRWRTLPQVPASVDEEDAIVWIIPTISRRAQRPHVEAAQHAAYLVLGNWGAMARPAYRHWESQAPLSLAGGIGHEAADSAATWLGDRCPILMRVRPAPARAIVACPPTSREAAATLAVALAGMAEILRDWSMQLEQAAAQPSAIPPAIDEVDAPSDAASPPAWLEPTTSLLLLGL